MSYPNSNIFTCIYLKVICNFSMYKTTVPRTTNSIRQVNLKRYTFESETKQQRRSVYSITWQFENKQIEQINWYSVSVSIHKICTQCRRPPQKLSMMKFRTEKPNEIHFEQASPLRHQQSTWHETGSVILRKKVQFPAMIRHAWWNHVIINFTTNEDSFSANVDLINKQIKKSDLNSTYQ